MRTRKAHSLGVRLAAVFLLSLVLPGLVVLPAVAGSTQWGGGSGNWTGGTWNPSEPTLSDDATFPATGGTITLSSGEQALSLTFDDSYTLSAGELTIGGTGDVSVSVGKTVNVTCTIDGTGGLTKTGDGSLLLSAAATYSGATTVSAGTLKRSVPIAFPTVTSASLRLRLESDMGVTTSGSNVTQWNDQSGNGFHCSQGDSNKQPILVANASPNGLLSAVRFDGLRDANGDYLSSGSPLQKGRNGTTFFVVYRPQNTPVGGTGENVMFYFGSASGGAMRGVIFWNSETPNTVFRAGFAGYAAGDLPDKYDVNVGTTHLATFSLNDDRNFMSMYDRTNGMASSSLMWSGAESGLNNTGAGYALSGQGINAANYPYKGDICAVLVYTGQLSDSDRQAVDNYLYNKYFSDNATNAGLPSATSLAIASSGTFDLNSSSQTAVSVTDSAGSGGTVRNSDTSGTSTLTLGGANVGSVSFSGALESGGANGVLNLAFTGSSTITQALSGSVTLNSLNVSNPNATVNIANSNATLATLAVSGGVVNFNSMVVGSAQTVTQTFTTAGLQTFIPTKSGNAEFYIWGAGGGGRIVGSDYGGGGGCTTGTLAVVAGKTYQIMVGGGGAGGYDNEAPPAAPAGGGGQPGAISYSGQGGGLSGIFLTSYDWGSALAIAGGGGGGGVSGAGGAGGGASGVNGSGSNAGTGGSQSACGVNGYSEFDTIFSDALQGGGSWYGGDDGGGGGGGGGYFGGGAGYNGDSPAGNSAGGGGSGYIGGAGVSGASTTAGSGATPANTSSPYYVVGTGTGGLFAGGNGQVTIVAPAISGAAVTLSGGTINFGDDGSGAAAAGADFSGPGAGVARADYALPLTIGSYLKLPGGTVASLSGAASFTAAGSNLADNSVPRTLTLPGGTLTFFTSPAASSNTLPTVTTGTLTLRLEADSGVIESGGKVSAWNDQSGNGYNATQGTPANQPVYVAGASANGLYGAIRFDGSRTVNGDYLTHASAVMPNDAMTMFVVYAPRVNIGGAVNEQVPFYWGQAGSGRLRSLYLNGASSPLNAGFAGYGADAGVNKFTVVAGTQYLSSFQMQDLNTLQEYNRKAGDSSSTQYYDGTGMGFNNPGVNGYVVGGVPLPSLYNYPSLGDISAILVYNGSISTADRQAVDDYLYNKYFAAPGPGAVNLTNTTIAATADATISLAGASATNTLAGLNVAAGATLVVTNSLVLNISNLTVSASGANCGTVVATNGTINIVTGGTLTVNGSPSGDMIVVLNPTAAGSSTFAGLSEGAPVPGVPYVISYLNNRVTLTRTDTGTAFTFR